VSADIEILRPRLRGRPSLYDETYCERVIELAAEGCGKTEIAAALSICRKTLNSWMKAHPGFRDAMERAKDLEYAWWLGIGRKSQFDKNWNAGSWNLQMRNRFGSRFSDGAKGATKEKSEDPRNAERLRGEMERKLSRIADEGGEKEIPREPYARGAE
jgi:hypothetical protein